MTKLLKFSIPLFIFSVFMIAGCISDDDYSNDSDDDLTTPSTQNTESTAGTALTTETSGLDVETFDIALNTSALTESAETVPTDEDDDHYDDYIENSSFEYTVNVVFDDDVVTVSGLPDYVTADIDGADIVINSTLTEDNVDYVLSGSSSDGSFKIYSEKKFELTFNGLSLTNADGAAINIQSGKRIFVNVADGTTNTLVDGEEYESDDSEEDLKACFYSEEQLIFSGSGKLNVTGNYKSAIASDDYVYIHAGTNIEITANAGNGIKANDGIYIAGGVLNITSNEDDSNGLSSDDYITITGGRTTIISNGDAVWDSDEGDTSGSNCVKADLFFTMSGGELDCKNTGDGGKGISCDTTITINGGLIKVIAEGDQYNYGSYDSDPKGIKSDYDIIINDGTVVVRTDNENDGSEAIESKNDLIFNGGVVEAYAYDDGLNASNSIIVNDGYLYIQSIENDAFDSNGDLYFNGGVTVAIGGVAPDEAFDCYTSGIFGITGGTVMGYGPYGNIPSTNYCTQNVILYSASASSNTYFSLADDDTNENILVFKTPKYLSTMTLTISSPLLETGGSYTLSSGGTVSGGSDFHGLITGGSYSGGSTITTFSTSSSVTIEGTIEETPDDDDTNSFPSSGGSGSRPGM